jgi:hypothetical protein
VSPLSRDEVAIYLGPRKLVLVRRARLLRERVLAASELVVPAAAPGDVKPALARLAEVLRESIWQRAAARVVVADPWTRFGVVPWPATRLDAAGRLTHARYVLGDAHGAAVADWAVTLADAPPGRANVACAVPAALRGALDETLAPARLTLVSLQPRLVVAFNAWRRRLPADDAWFVSVDDGALCAVHLAGGAWDRVHVERLSSRWAVELARLLTFCRLTGGPREGPRVFVDAPAWMRTGAAAGAGVEWLARNEEGEAPAEALAPAGGRPA